MDAAEGHWRPSATLDTLRARARLYAAVRVFFSARGVLEVETPVLSQHATVDRHIDSFRTLDGRWLHTSPEFAMKRLLAAGSGPIWQLARVFRLEESGRHHSPEFSMLEWYRPGWDHQRLMDEVQALFADLGAAQGPFARHSYRDALREHAGVDPFDATLAELQAAGARHGLQPPQQAGGAARDFWLDGLMSLAVSPRLGLDRPEFIHDFPASQSALARVRPGDPPLAERFELFWRGLELANGFHELADADEQRRRFSAELAERGAQGRVQPPADQHLLQALAAGFPDCAGVALGLDRLLMLMLDLPRLADTLAFDAQRA